MKRIKYSRFFILGVFIYLIFKGITLLIGLNTSVLVLKDNFYTMKTKEKSIIIRDEYLIKSNTSGTISLLADSNEKVQKSQNIAIVYNNMDNSINKDINSLKKEIRDLKKDNNPLKVGILSAKKEELNILEKKIKSNTTNYYANTSGVVSYKYDSNENKYNSQNLSNLTKEDIESANNNYITTVMNNEKVKQDTTIARLINNNNCYIAFISSKDNKLFNEGDSVKIGINNDTMNGEIYKIYNKNNYFIIIVKIIQQNLMIYDTRVAEFDIIYKQMKALKVPKKSIVKEDNKSGVYVVNEENNKPKFTEIKGISFEDDNYVYVDFKDNEINGVNTVKLHDRIILKPNFINKRIAKVN